MSKKYLLGLGLISFVCMQAFALEINKGRIISHKEWTTDNDITFTVKHPQTLSQLRLFLGGGAYKFYTQLPVTNGKINSDTIIDGDNFIQIINETNTTQTYQYLLSTCAQDASNDLTQPGVHPPRPPKCGYIKDVIQLDPGGSYGNVQEPQLTIKYTRAGNYNTFVTAFISANEGPVKLTANSASYAVISN